MRHYEEFEMEHLINGTGNWFFRFRCRRHLRYCEICRKRYEHLQADRTLLRRLRSSLERLEHAEAPDGAPRDGRERETR